MSAKVKNLIAARELVARPGGWCQGVYAKDMFGNMFADFGEVISEDVCSVCMVGALAIALGTSPYGAESSEEYTAICGEVGDVIPLWNDNLDRTQAEVVAAFDRVIEAERAAA